MKGMNFHDQYNIGCTISSTGNSVCGEERSNKSSGSVSGKPEQYLPLEEPIRWELAKPERKVTPAASSSCGAYGGRI